MTGHEIALNVNDVNGVNSVTIPLTTLMMLDRFRSIFPGESVCTNVKLHELQKVKFEILPEYISVPTPNVWDDG